MSPKSHTDAERRFPRRFLIAVPATAAAATVAGTARADAAPPGTAWALGGNGNVSTNGSNWLGTRNAAPLIVKTSNGGTPVERMRVQANGRVGIGTAAPGTSLDVKGAAANEGVVRSTMTSQGSSGAFRGIASKAGGFGGWFSGRGGGVWAQGLGNQTQGVFASGTYGVRAVGTQVGVQATANGEDGVGLRAIGSSDGGWAIEATNTGYGGITVEASGVAVDAVAQTGVYAIGLGENGRGVYAYSNGGRAAHLDGDVLVSGTLTEGRRLSRIDHPADPARRWLTHAGVDAPEAKDVYDGNATTGADGRASVRVPGYVEALGRDFRYQLTVIGDFAQAVVSRELRDGRFEIRTDRPRVRVSWQVTALRDDAYTRDHPVRNETAKTGDELGTRQYVPPGSGARPMPAPRPPDGN